MTFHPPLSCTAFKNPVGRPVACNSLQRPHKKTVNTSVLSSSPLMWHCNQNKMAQSISSEKEVVFFYNEQSCSLAKTPDAGIPTMHLDHQQFDRRVKCVQLPAWSTSCSATWQRLHISPSNLLTSADPHQQWPESFHHTAQQQRDLFKPFTTLVGPVKLGTISENPLHWIHICGELQCRLKAFMIHLERWNALKYSQDLF